MHIYTHYLTAVSVSTLIISQLYLYLTHYLTAVLVFTDLDVSHSCSCIFTLYLTVQLALLGPNQSLHKDHINHTIQQAFQGEQFSLWGDHHNSLKAGNTQEMNELNN